VVIVAPLVEELLFRGLLLRSLARRTSTVAAVVISAAAFAAVHLLDPSAAPALAPLLLVGLVAAIRTVRTGDLSQAILLHGGFNLLSAVVLVAG
jgi:membrane protease YdiL (CAAX protease family)